MLGLKIKAQRWAAHQLNRKVGHIEGDTLEWEVVFSNTVVTHI